MGLSFASPRYLWLIPLTFALVLGGMLLAKRQQRKLAQWVDLPLWKFVIPEYSKTVFNFKHLTLMLLLFLLSLSAARPQWGEHDEILKSEGMDILFVLDVSNSMLSEDAPPSRLRRAQTFVKKTLGLLPNDRAGIVAFAGSAYLAVPLTTDFGYVTEVIESLDPGVIANQGTNVGQALDVAMNAFERGAEDDHKTSRAIILISDGEDFGNEALKAAQHLKDFGAGFFTLSVGSAEGAPIPLRNETGVLQSYKKDQAGKPVLSRVNKDLMSRLAEAGGGKFFDLVNPDDTASAVSKMLLSYGRDSRKEQHEVSKIDRYQWFLGLGILFLFLHLFIGYRPLIAMFVVGFLFTGTAQAQNLDSYLKSRRAAQQYEGGDFEGSAHSFEDARKEGQDNATLQFNEGTALAKGKKGEDALFHLQEATKKALSQGDYETAAKSLYNEGAVHMENKNLKEAYDRLTKSIEMAKISGQTDLEKKGREALVSLVEKQKQQSQDQKEQKDKEKKEGKDSKGKSPSDEKGTEKEKENQKEQDQKSQNEKKKENPSGTEQRSFKSGTLSKDVAESIMHDLSDREKQLYQKRMKERKAREINHDKDW